MSSSPLQSRQAEFEAWEEQVARERNRGQFFQGLYESAKDSRKKTKSKAAEKSLHSDAASLSSGEASPLLLHQRFLPGCRTCHFSEQVSCTARCSCDM